MGLGHLCGHQPPWDPSWCHALHQQGHSIVGLDETFGAHQVFPKGHTNQEKCSINAAFVSPLLPMCLLLANLFLNDIRQYACAFNHINTYDDNLRRISYVPTEISSVFDILQQLNLQF